ncbi:class I adenylate-forming enzyme family protein [Streptomyces violascens]|uniref:class I adenylate-forming enzyme family protein n=1 Tax=Streptomyces violascens TaxID=67381 RepID=UPI0036BFCD6C
MAPDETAFRAGLIAAVRDGGERPAVITTDRVLSYRTLDRESDGAAGALVRAGITTGAVVTLAMPNGWAWIVGYLAVLKSGAVLAPANSLLTPTEITALHRLTAPTTVLGHPSDLHHPAQAPRPNGIRPPAAACLLAHTSGTTGTPRTVVQTEQALYAAVQHWTRQRQENDVVATALPLAHTYGHLVAASTLQTHATLVLADRFRPGELLALIIRHRATIIEGVPTMYARLLTHAPPGAIGHLRCLSSGQAVPDTLARRWRERTGLPLIQSWGMTELSGPGLSFAPDRTAQDGWAGHPAPGYELTLRPLTGETSQEHGRGEILVRGPGISPGSYDQCTGTTRLTDTDGWLHTGDVAEKNTDGCFRILDRRQDVISSGGYNIYPGEVENALLLHPAVLATAVTGIPHHDLGEVPRAHVVPAPGHSADAETLLRHCHTYLADYKVPRSVVFCSSLPSTSSGKIRRDQLRHAPIRTPD